MSKFYTIKEEFMTALPIKLWQMKLLRQVIIKIYSPYLLITLFIERWFLINVEH